MALGGGHLLDLAIPVDDAQHIHQLALVLVNPLHLWKSSQAYVLSRGLRGINQGQS